MNINHSQQFGVILAVDFHHLLSNGFNSTSTPNLYTFLCSLEYLLPEYTLRAYKILSSRKVWTSSMVHSIVLKKWPLRIKLRIIYLSSSKFITVPILKVVFFSHVIGMLHVFVLCATPFSYIRNTKYKIITATNHKNEHTENEWITPSPFEDGPHNKYIAVVEVKKILPVSIAGWEKKKIC